MIKKLPVSRVVLIVLAVLLAVAIFLKVTGVTPPGRPGRDNLDNKSLTKSTFSVNSFTVNKGVVTNYIRLNGDVVAGTSVEIYPDTAGELINRSVSVGDYVVKGQEIAQVDPSRPGAIYVASPVETTISGTVTRLAIDNGESVNSQISIATIGDLRNLEIKAYVPEKFIGGITTGLDADLTFEPYPGETFKAEVTELSPVLDSNSRTMEISLTLTGDKDSRIKAGMFASIVLYTEVRNDVVQIPVESLIEGDSEYYVYVVNGDKAEKRVVETGLTSLTNVEIKTGLTTGESVIFRGQSLLTDGASIKVLEK